MASWPEMIVQIGSRVVGCRHHSCRWMATLADGNRDRSNAWRSNSRHTRRVPVVLVNDDRPPVSYLDVCSRRPDVGLRRRRIGSDQIRDDSIVRRGGSDLVRVCS